MSLLLAIAVNIMLVSYIGPVFKISSCGYESNIFEKQNCVEQNTSDMLIWFGSLSYFFALVTYLLDFSKQKRLYVLASSSTTLVFVSCYAYFLSATKSVEKWSVGYYFTYVVLGLFLAFMVVYKLNVRWLLK
jgi:hypothetical protein